jgi:hypothetical protein
LIIIDHQDVHAPRVPDAVPPGQGLRSGSARRQLHDHRSAAVVAELRRAAVRLGDRLDDGEPEAVAPAGAGRAGEPFERVRQIVRRETIAGIAT